MKVLCSREHVLVDFNSLQHQLNRRSEIKAPVQWKSFVPESMFWWTPTTLQHRLNRRFRIKAPVHWMYFVPERLRIFSIPSVLPVVTVFLQKTSNGYVTSSTLYKGTPWLISVAFDTLKTWGHPWEEEKELWAKERRSSVFVCASTLKNSSFASVASVLELGPTECRSSEGLGACYSWCLAAPRRSWWSKCFSRSLPRIVGARRRRLYVAWAPPRRDGERRLLVSAQVSVTWEVTRLLVSVTTWIRGVCQHIDTTGKIRLSLALSLISSTYFHAIFHVLDLRDHSLALPCLVSYLVVSL